jgi:hypothetical protein
MATLDKAETTIDLDEILVPIPSVAEVVKTGLEQLRPQFNLTDEQIERLGRRSVARAK